MYALYILFGTLLVRVLVLFPQDRFALFDVRDDLIVDGRNTLVAIVLPSATALKNLLSVAEALELGSNGFKFIGLLADANGLVDAHFRGKVISKGLHCLLNGSFKLGAGT